MRLTTLALDVAVVLVFAVAGRASHYDTVTLTGVLGTAWPFVVGLALGWLLAGRTRWALRSLPAGLLIWPVTVLTGMAIRLLTGQGTALAFVLVAIGTLALGLLGWRLIAAVVARQQRSNSERSTTDRNTAGRPAPDHVAPAQQAPGSPTPVHRTSEHRTSVHRTSHDSTDPAPNPTGGTS